MVNNIPSICSYDNRQYMYESMVAQFQWFKGSPYIMPSARTPPIDVPMTQSNISMIDFPVICSMVFNIAIWIRPCVTKKYGRIKFLLLAEFSVSLVKEVSQTRISIMERYIQLSSRSLLAATSKPTSQSHSCLMLFWLPHISLVCDLIFCPMF